MTTGNTQSHINTVPQKRTTSTINVVSSRWHPLPSKFLPYNELKESADKLSFLLISFSHCGGLGTAELWSTSTDRYYWCCWWCKHNFHFAVSTTDKTINLCHSSDTWSQEVSPGQSNVLQQDKNISCYQESGVKTEHCHDNIHFIIGKYFFYCCSMFAAA